MKTTKYLALCLAVLMTVLCLASCGGNGGSNSSTSGTTATVAATKTAKVIDVPLTDEQYAFGVDKDQPELLTKVNEFIKEIMGNGKFDEICDKYFGDGTPTPVKSATLDESKDQLVVATNAAFEPFEYTSGSDYLGIDMEIAALLAEKLGKELVVQNMDFDAVCLSVGQHKCDIGMAGLTIKPEREEYVTFSDSYYNASQKLIVKTSDTAFDACKAAADVEAILNGLDSSVKIGTQQGTTGQFYVEGDEDWGFTGYKATCVTYKNGSLAVQDLLNGNLTYVIIDSAPATCIVEAINKVA